LTAFVDSGTTPRMGRPPLNNKPTLVRLSPEVRQAIEGHVGSKGMAGFIREAVDRELKRRGVKASPPTLPSKAKSKDAE
jgi:hypothetical protein